MSLRGLPWKGQNNIAIAPALIPIVSFFSSAINRWLRYSREMMTDLTGAIIAPVVKYGPPNPIKPSIASMPEPVSTVPVTPVQTTDPALISQGICPVLSRDIVGNGTNIQPLMSSYNASLNMSPVQLAVQSPAGTPVIDHMFTSFPDLTGHSLAMPDGLSLFSHLMYVLIPIGIMLGWAVSGGIWHLKK